MNGSVCAVIVAAGSSARMGEDKMLIELFGETVLERTVRAFEDCGAIEKIIVVAAEKNIMVYGNLIKSAGFRKVSQIVRGGASRQESAMRAISCLDETTGYVAVHDGARPLIQGALILKTLEAAREFGAAALGEPCPDSLKKIDGGGFITETVKREGTVRIQTPQIFELGLLRRAHEDAARLGLEATDDCELVERTGARIKVVPGGYDNIKLTTPTDICFAKAVIAARGAWA